MNHRAVERIRLTRTDPEAWLGVSAPQKKLLAVLAERGELTIEAAQTATGSALTTVIPKLEEAGLIERDVSVVDSAPGQQMVRFIRLTDAAAPDLGKAPQQEAVVDYLRWRARVAANDWDGFVSLKEVVNRTGATAAAISALKRKDLIEEEARAPARIPPAPEFRPVPSFRPSSRSRGARLNVRWRGPKAETIPPPRRHRQRKNRALSPCGRVGVAAGRGFDRAGARNRAGESGRAPVRSAVSGPDRGAAFRDDAERTLSIVAVGAIG